MNRGGGKAGREKKIPALQHEEDNPGSGAEDGDQEIMMRKRTTPRVVWQIRVDPYQSGEIHRQSNSTGVPSLWN